MRLKLVKKKELQAEIKIKIPYEKKRINRKRYKDLCKIL